MFFALATAEERSGPVEWESALVGGLRTKNQARYRGYLLATSANTSRPLMDVGSNTGIPMFLLWWKSRHRRNEHVSANLWHYRS